MQYNFEAYQQGKLIFHSDGHWLHPIFEFEQKLKSGNIRSENIFIKDKIIGRAAALLLVRLQVKKIFAATISEPAKELLLLHGVEFKFDRLISRVNCRSEDLLMDVTDPQDGFELVIKLRDGSI